MTSGAATPFAAAILGGIALGVGGTLLAARAAAPPPPDPGLERTCAGEVQLRTTALLDLKEEVEVTRVAWNRLEIELGPVGGVPSWWRSGEALDAARAAATARGASLGAPATVEATDCDEDPCLILVRGAPAPEPAEGEIVTEGEGRFVLALPPDGAPTPARVARTARRSDRLLGVEER